METYKNEPKEMLEHHISELEQKSSLFNQTVEERMISDDLDKEKFDDLYYRLGTLKGHLDRAKFFFDQLEEKK